MPKDKGLRPEFKPAGTPEFKETSRNHKIEVLTAQRDAISKGMIDIATKEVVGADKKIAREVLDKTEKIAFPSPMDNLSKEELSAVQQEKKSFDKSQSFVNGRLLFDVRYVADVNANDRDVPLKKSPEKDFESFFKQTEYPNNKSQKETVKKDADKDKPDVEKPEGDNKENLKADFSNNKKDILEQSIKNFAEQTSFDNNRNISTPDIDPDKIKY